MTTNPAFGSSLAEAAASAVALLLWRPVPPVWLSSGVLSEAKEEETKEDEGKEEEGKEEEGKEEEEKEEEGKEEEGGKEEGGKEEEGKEEGKWLEGVVLGREANGETSTLLLLLEGGQGCGCDDDELIN